MGDRWFITVECPQCSHVEGDVYFAPTCDFTYWTCSECGYVLDLEQYTGITVEGASNAEEIADVMGLRPYPKGYGPSAKPLRHTRRGIPKGG